MARLKQLNEDEIDKIVRKTTKDLAKSANIYMRNFGQGRVKTMMSETIEEKVYNRYTPRVYKRRRKNKGLADTGNMKRDVKIDDWNTREIVGHLKITNKTKRVPISKKEYEYADKCDDFLYMIKDEGRVYDFTKGHSPTYEEWGNGGRPLNLNKALDKKVQSSEKFQAEFRRMTLKGVKK